MVIVPTNKIFEIGIQNRFIFQDIPLFPSGMKDPPYMLSLKGLIKLLNVPNTKPPMFFGCTNSLPSHQWVLLVTINVSPKKIPLDGLQGVSHFSWDRKEAKSISR